MNTQLTGLLMLLLDVSVESLSQLALKIGSAGGPAVLRPRFRSWTGLCPAAERAGLWLLAGVIGYGIEVVFYTLALNCLEVTVAFPLGSLCFVGVAVLSKIFLGEAVGGIRWLGIACILAGTVLLAL